MRCRISAIDPISGEQGYFVVSLAIDSDAGDVAAESYVIIRPEHDVHVDALVRWRINHVMIDLGDAYLPTASVQRRSAAFADVARALISQNSEQVRGVAIA